MGPSGSGKSTLMHCMAALDTTTGGQVYLGDIELTGLNDKQLTNLRRDKIGFVFQAYNLVPTLTARENIELPLAIAGRKPDPDWFDTVIDTVGLRDRLEAPTQRAVRRPAAARRLRAGPGVAPGDRVRRRADRQPRLHVRRRGAWVPAPQRR